MSRFLTISYTLLNTFSFSFSLRISPMAIRRPDSLPGTINPQDILKYVNCISCKDIKENSKILLCGHTICVACLGDAANSKNNYTCSSCQTVTSFPYKTAVKLQTNFLAKPCKEYLARCETRGANDLASPMEIALKAKSPHVLLIKSHKYVECCRDVIKQTEEVSCLFVCLNVCLFVCLLVYWFICLFIGLLVCLFVCLFVCLLFTR